ncbi:hypothetical protein [uncultured Desulfosarcina sp.]|uniref:hypothetical protein n=1 Tax=uncultured Desulfosarcina sp. TaxID=218289 RepID=UPI0029C7D81E|nr:hypothetical protein [uncultured Desulfosarcina sp.]
MTNYSEKKVEYFTRIKISTIIVAAVGVLMVIVSFKFIPGSTSSLISYLLLNLGGLFIFGGTYTFISELYLRKKYTVHMESMLSNALKEFTFCQNVFDYGMHNVIKVYNNNILIERIKKSKEVKMLVIRNASFFEYYSPELKDLIIHNGLKLELFFLDPESDVLPIVSKRFLDTSKNDLTDKTKYVVQYIKNRIYDELPDDLKSNVKLSYYELYPAYSAYIFDDYEMWFVPYFFRKEKRPVPIFIFSDQTKIKSTEIYKDIIAVMQKSKEVKFVELG